MKADERVRDFLRTTCCPHIAAGEGRLAAIVLVDPVAGNAQPCHACRVCEQCRWLIVQVLFDQVGVLDREPGAPR